MFDFMSTPPSLYARVSFADVKSKREFLRSASTRIEPTTVPSIRYIPTIFFFFFFFFFFLLQANPVFVSGKRNPFLHLNENGLSL